MADEITARFLRPTYAIDVDTAGQWPIHGAAETPGEDARCRIYLALGDDARLAARFAAFGPPVVIACADWLCEQVSGEPIENARDSSVAAIEKALALAATQRYAGALAIDALANAVRNLGS